jgi:hypothetical protein
MGQDDSFEWVWRYADAMLMWPMIVWPIVTWRVIVTQMSQNLFIVMPQLSIY